MGLTREESRISVALADHVRIEEPWDLSRAVGPAESHESETVHSWDKQKRISGNRRAHHALGNAPASRTSGARWSSCAGDALELETSAPLRDQGSQTALSHRHPPPSGLDYAEFLTSLPDQKFART